MCKENCKDALVTVNSPEVSFGSGERSVSNKVRVVHVSFWLEEENSLILYRENNEIARFKNWTSIQWAPDA